MVLVLALFFARAWGLAEEIPTAKNIRYFSPDKKFAVRIAYDPSLLPENGEEIPPEATRKLELVAMPSEEVMLDFSDEEGGLQGKSHMVAGLEMVRLCLIAWPACDRDTRVPPFR